MSNLILCSACQRHVRDREVQCPFCHAVITPEAREAAVRPLPPPGVPRAKLYAVGAAVAASVAAVACGGDDTTGSQEGGTAQTGGSSGTEQAGGASGTAQAGGASGSAQAGGASGSAQNGGAAGDTQAGGAAGAVADSGVAGQGGVQADAKPDVPLAHPYGCVFADPSRTTKV